MLSREIPLVNLWPPELLFYFVFYFPLFFISASTFNLVSGKNKGGDDPLSFVGCKTFFCLCAGAAKIDRTLPPTSSINLGS